MLDSIISITAAVPLSASAFAAFFMSALVLLFGNTEYVRGLMNGRSFLVFVCAFVGVNAVVEMLVCTVVSGFVGSALYRAKILPLKKKT